MTRITLSVLGVLLLLLSGCTSKQTPNTAGVLSTVQQKTLTIATEEALENADITEESFDTLFGKRKLNLTFDAISDSDLGRKHVAGIVKDRVRSMSGGLDKSGKTLHCTVLLAGVDVARTNLGIYQSRITKADVKLRLDYGGKDYEGEGNAQYEQKWLVGATIKDEMGEEEDEEGE